MGHYSIANILLISSLESYVQRFTSYFTERDYSVTNKSSDTCIDYALSNHPDLIIVDVDCNDFDGFTIVKAFKENTKTNHIPVICIAEEKNDALFDKAIEYSVDDIFIHDFDMGELLVLLKPLLRLSTMYLELDERVAIANQMGIKSARSTLFLEDQKNTKILLVQPMDGDKALLETLLDEKHYIETSDDFFDAEERLITGGFVACIASLHDDNSESVMGLCSRARNNPRLFNLPMMVLDDGTLDDRKGAYKRGVTRVANRPLDHGSLKAKLDFLIKRQSLRWSIRQALDTTKEEAITDEITNSYTKEFFQSHFERQVIRAHQWNKHLSLIFFSIPNIPTVKKQFGEKSSNHLLQQISQWINSLVRVEDIVCRFDDHVFCVALPDTPMDETQIVMHRIAGILSYTDFAIVDVFQPISVWVEVGSSSLDLNDTYNQIIERARKNID